MSQELFSGIEVTPVANAGKLKASGKVLIAGVVSVKFRVMEGTNGLFVALPSTKGKDGKYYAEVFIPDETTRQQLQEVVLSTLSKGGAKPAAKKTPVVDDNPF